jgi:hypothetical protein
MKTALLFTVCAAAFFAGGYFTGRSGSSPEEAAGVSKIARTAGAKTITGSAAANAAAGSAEVREFQPGRPFAPGGAKAWLLSLAAKLAEQGGGDFPIELVDLAQIFVTMDEGSITEVNAALSELMAMYEADDPLLKSINDMDDMLEGALIVSAFRLSQLNPAAAIEQLSKGGKEVPDEIAKLIFARLAAKEPAKAEAMLDSLQGDTRRHAVEGMIHGLMGRDPEAALALAEKYPEGQQSYNMNRLLQRMVERDPAKAIAAAVRMTEKKDAGVLLETFHHWQEKDQNAALKWAETYTGAGQSSVRGHQLQQRAASDPEGAAQEFLAVQKEATPQDRLGNAAWTIADELADRDVAAAVDWAGKLKEGEARTQAMQKAMGRWLTEDSAAASAWLNQQPLGAERDQLTGQLIESIYRSDPAGAFEWARNIQNPAARREQLERVYQDWNERDAEAAKAAASTLPEDQRKDLK